MVTTAMDRKRPSPGIAIASQYRITRREVIVKDVTLSAYNAHIQIVHCYSHSKSSGSEQYRGTEAFVDLRLRDKDAEKIAPWLFNGRATLHRKDRRDWSKDEGTALALTRVLNSIAWQFVYDMPEQLRELDDFSPEREVWLKANAERITKWKDDKAKIWTAVFPDKEPVIRGSVEKRHRQELENARGAPQSSSSPAQVEATPPATTETTPPPPMTTNGTHAQTAAKRTTTRPITTAGMHPCDKLMVEAMKTGPKTMAQLVDYLNSKGHKSSYTKVYDEVRQRLKVSPYFTRAEPTNTKLPYLWKLAN